MLIIAVSFGGALGNEPFTVSAFTSSHESDASGYDWTVDFICSARNLSMDCLDEVFVIQNDVIVKHFVFQSE